jgi:uncharacterized membrane protein SpoIIM required for sporulation
MREALFVKQNSAKWKQYESFKSDNPDELAQFFIDVTDDLAYAKTFYPGSKTTGYLNGLASRFHQIIYRNKKESSNRFFHFWKLELPFLFKKYERAFLYSFIFFVTACIIGAISAKYDEQFLRLILGDRYVNMTNENIAKGDPFGVYKQSSEFSMFTRIAFNNVRVAIYTFATGIFVSIGTVISLINNGIMLGSFEYYFFSKGLGWQSVLVVWIHGTLEISAIILAGGAGLILGNSILFPKTYNRIESLKRGAKDGLKICIGIAPIFIFAAFLEGFITRHTEMPVWQSILILSGSLLFMVWYVIIYPDQLVKSSKLGNR